MDNINSYLENLIKEYSKKHFDIEEDPTGNISFDGGFLNGFIDLVFQHNYKFYIIDWKSNSIHGNMENFALQNGRQERYILSLPLLR